jgi:hypothetical protein
MQKKYCNQKRREEATIFTILYCKVKVLESLLFNNIIQYTFYALWVDLQIHCYQDPNK